MIVTLNIISYLIALSIFSLVVKVIISKANVMRSYAIREFVESSGEAVNASDLNTEVNRFTEYGIYMWLVTQSIVGQMELRKLFKKRFSKVKVEPENLTEEIALCGHLAFERGKYIAHIKLKENNKMYSVK